MSLMALAHADSTRPELGWEGETLQEAYVPRAPASHPVMDSLTGLASRFAGGIVSALTGARLTILIYHRVLEHRDPLSPTTPDVVTFERGLRWLSSQFRVIGLHDAIERLCRGELPTGCASITFDDGYADNATLALPVLEKLGLTATFFVSTGFLDGGRMWNDTVIETIRRTRDEVIDLDEFGLDVHQIADDAQRRATIAKVLRKLKYFPLDEREQVANAIGARVQGALPKDLMMTREQVRRLYRGGMSIGGHTVRHPILACLNDEAAQCEIVSGKLALEEIIDAPVRLFAFPNGQPGRDYTAQHVAMVRSAGFEGAVSTASGVATASSDPFQLPRFMPASEYPIRFRAQLLRNLLESRSEIV